MVKKNRVYEDEIIQEISRLTGELVKHNLKKFKNSGGDPDKFISTKGTLETGDDDSFFDYIPNGLVVLSAVLSTLSHFYGDGSPDLAQAEKSKFFSSSDIVHLDFTVREAKKFNELLALIGVEPTEE